MKFLLNDAVTVVTTEESAVQTSKKLTSRNITGKTASLNEFTFVSADNADAAKAIDDRLQSLNTALFVESNPIPVKWALQQMGLISEGIRLPLTPFAMEYHEQMLAALKTAGVVLEGN